ncbi:MAG: TIR domain-containing protein [Acidobacteriaceae bacterium]|nr:TIR domain-containing protein [Acidobacteriaceae bacterium]
MAKSPQCKIRVFISYSSENVEQARAIHAALETEGFEVWRDERRIETDWSADIAEALAHSDVICLIWTKAAAGSGWVKNEWLSARALEKLIVPCLFPGAPDLPKPIENLQGVKFSKTPVGLRDLTARLKSSASFHKKYDFRVFPPNGHVHVPFAPDDDFTGRNDDLLALYLELIGQLNKIGISHVGAAGMGGVGKTALAVEFAYRFAFAFDGVYWIQAADSSQLSAELVWLARDILRLKIATPKNADANSQYLRELYSHSKKHPQMLLILDNLGEPELLASAAILPGVHFAPLDLGCNLLFTTRRQFKLTGVKAHPVDVLSPHAALDLLARSRRPETGDDRGKAEEICNAVGYLPLALVLIGAYLRNYAEISFGRYLTMLRKHGLAAIDTTRIDASSLATRHAAAVGVTLQGQWKVVRDPNARLVLKIAAHFSESAIVPRNRIGLLAGLGAGRTEMDLPLASAIKVLQRLSLIQEVENGTAVRIHPLVAKFVRGAVAERVRSHFLFAAAAKLKAAYDDPSRLESEYRHRGINQVIGDLNAAIPWASGRAPVERKLSLLQRVLDRERQHLQSPHPEAQELAPNFFQQLHHRASMMGLPELAAKFLQAGLADGRPMLSVQASSAMEDPARVRTLQGHSIALKALGVSSDGHRLISASMDRRMILWDLETGQMLRSMKGHKYPILDVAISPDGRSALSGGRDKKLIFWNLETGEKLWTRREHSGTIEFVKFSADGRMALTGSLDETLICWDVSSGRKISRLKGHKHGVVAGAMSRDSRYALSGDTEGHIFFWDLKKASSVYSFHIDPPADNIKRGITALDLTPDAKFAVIATGYKNRYLVDYFGPDRNSRLLLWNLEARRFVREFEGHTLPVNGVAFSSDGRRVLSGSSDKTLKLWHATTGKCQRTFVGHSREIQAVVLTLDDRYAISAGFEGNAIVWEMDAADQAEPSSRRRTQSAGHSLWVRSVDLSADGTIAATSSDDATVALWNAKTGRLLHFLQGHSERVNSVKLTADASLAVSADHHGTIMLWNAKTGKQISAIETKRGRIHAVNASPDGRTALSGDLGNWLMVWDVEKGELLQPFQHVRDFVDEDSDGITAILLSNDGRTAITAAEDSTKLFLWNLALVTEFRTQILAANPSERIFLQEQLEEAIATLKGHSSGVLALDYDGRNARLLSGSSDHTVILWDLKKKCPLMRLEGHSQIVNAVGLANAQRAVSASWDKTLILWNLDSGKPLLQLYLENPVWALAARGHQMVAGDVGGIVYFFAIKEPNTKKTRNTKPAQ